MAIKAGSKSNGSFFKDINDLVIVRQHQAQNDTFSIYKKVNAKVVINNIWKNGKLIKNDYIFEKNSKPNFHRKLLKCTSFETAPMIYKTHPEAKTLEGGYEVNENSKFIILIKLMFHHYSYITLIDSNVERYGKIFEFFLHNQSSNGWIQMGWR